MEDFLNFLIVMLVPYMLGVAVTLVLFRKTFEEEREGQKLLEEKNKELERKNYRLQNKIYEDEKHIEFLHTAVDVEYEKQQNNLW
ncbi:hypothetical protein WAF17_10675 [Bernardetia sp. ABR2-2B]|uniref:hypothetical protein n=1 Tax=Bernardetia sp. ABR2-2B TaxID=3127472 RepID=UPI0030D2B6C5